MCVAAESCISLTLCQTPLFCFDSLTDFFLSPGKKAKAKKKKTTKAKKGKKGQPPRCAVR